MIELTRTIRFVIPLREHEAVESFGNIQSHPNTFAGSPNAISLGAYQELEISVRGEPDPTTGYLVNISHIDREVRAHALPLIWELIGTHPPADPSKLLAQVLSLLQTRISSEVSLIRWRHSPYHSRSMNAATPELVSISEQFEFSASHRLHVDSLSPQQNREVFGKCNNPNGHGHNYRIEPTVAVPTSHPAVGQPFTIHDLERIVDQVIIQRFDHKHLNLDTADFARMNPSVENIAKVCYQLLEEPLSRAGAKLEYVTIWETEKTRCVFPARG